MMIASSNTVTVDLSMSEIHALTWRAAKGVGYQWGEADEAAFAAVWLARAGMAWLDIVLSTLEGGNRESPKVAMGEWSGDGPLCALRCGIALADFASLPDGLKTESLTIRRIGNWLMLVPFVSRAAISLGSPVSLKTNGFETIIVPEGALVHPFPKEIPDPGDLTLKAISRTFDNPTAPPRQRAFATLTEFDRLSALAMKMTVPTSAVSQAGAGAAGGDND